MDLDGDEFSAVHSSVMRVRSREMKWHMNLRLATSHPDKKGKFKLKPLTDTLDEWLPTAELKAQSKTGGDLANALNPKRRRSIKGTGR